MLKQIEPPEFRGNQHVAGVGDRTYQTREDAAREAGMSKHQQVQATRIANVPKREFEQQIEAPRL